MSWFPAIVFLYCVFHLDQALRRTFAKMTDPGMGKDSFSRLKGFIIREVHELVCGRKGEPPIREEEFDRRAQLVSDLLWKYSLDTEATRWDSYVKNKERWAPFARWRACTTLFGERNKLPMLAVSNNVLESFFRVLKHVLLDGHSTTMMSVIVAWKGHQSRVLANLLSSNIDPKMILRTREFECEEIWEEEDDEKETGQDSSDSESEEEDESICERLERSEARALEKNKIEFHSLLGEAIESAQQLQNS